MKKYPQDFWNERYNNPDYIYGQEPNAFFQEQLTQLPSGKILLPAEGEGRNAVFAARNGWTVQAFDWSETGQQKANAWAAANQVSIDYEVAKAQDVSYQPGSFDALAYIYSHFTPDIRKEVTRKLLSYLRPGGHVIFECYSKEQLEYQLKYDSGGPKNAAMLYSEAEVRDEFAGLDFISLEVREVELNEGDHHVGLASVLRFVARLPGH